MPNESTHKKQRMKRLLITIITTAVVTGCIGNGTPKSSDSNQPKPHQRGQALHKGFVICQSCGIPLQKSEEFGTEADGSPSREYCTHCYQNGSFVWQCTMDEMIDSCALIIEKTKGTKENGLTRERAAELMMGYFPNLKRWKK